MSTKDDYTPAGLRIEGQYENDRNAQGSELFKAIIRECFGVKDVIIAHHLVYVATEQRDGFEYQIVEEIPSADALIFDHDVAKKLWGNGWHECLVQLALEPVETRDKLLQVMWNNRTAINELATKREALTGPLTQWVANARSE